MCCQWPIWMLTGHGHAPIPTVRGCRVVYQQGNIQWLSTTYNTKIQPQPCNYVTPLVHHAACRRIKAILEHRIAHQRRHRIVDDAHERAWAVGPSSLALPGSSRAHHSPCGPRVAGGWRGGCSIPSATHSTSCRSRAVLACWLLLKVHVGNT